MATRISQSFPAAALGKPSTEARETSLRGLRLELEAEEDAGKRALLLHEIARLHESRDDLAAAARDELSSTREAAGFVEALESLIGIATRSRSQANVAKLLQRIAKLSHSEQEQLRASLALCHVHLQNQAWDEARASIEAGLEQLPQSPELWLALEELAGQTADQTLLLRATIGRAAHAHNPEIRSLLLERVARLHLELGDPESAFASLSQSFDELPSFRSLRTWESLALTAGDFSQAQEAASRSASLLWAALDEPDEAELYQIPIYELSEERAVTTQFRALIYALRNSQYQLSESLAENLLEAAPQNRLARISQLALALRARSDEQAEQALANMLADQATHALSADEVSYVATLQSLLARSLSDSESEEKARQLVLSNAPESWLSRIFEWETLENKEQFSEEALKKFLQTLPLTHPLMGEPSSPQSTEGRDDTVADARSTEFESVQVALGLLQLLNQRFDRALELFQGLSTDNVDPLTLHLEALCARQIGNLPAEISAVQKLQLLLNQKRAQDSQGTEVARLEDDFFHFELLRLYLASRSTAVANESALSEEEVLQSFSANERTWLKLALQLSQGSERSQLLKELRSSNSLSTHELLAFSALELTERKSDGKFDDFDVPSLEAAASDSPAGAYVLGLRLAQAQLQLSQKAAEENEVEPSAALLEEAKLLQHNAPELSNKELLCAWKLRAALLFLICGEFEKALNSLDELTEETETSLERLRPWFALKRDQGRPEKLHQQLREVGSQLQEERSLLSLSLAARFSPESLEQLELTPALPAAERLFLSLIRGDREAIAQAQLFSETQIEAIPLLDRETSAEEKLEQVRTWEQSNPSATSLFALWTAARAAGDNKSLSLAIWELSQLTDSLTLALHAPQLARYSTDAAEARRQLLAARLEDKELSPEERATLSWANWEEAQSQDPQVQARAHQSLSESLDSELTDSEAQLAMLASAFQFAMNEEYDSALPLFERLFEKLPHDLSVCSGLQLVAASCGNAPLEAAATRELARLAKDNQSAAKLWEKAGEIFRDSLGDDTSAETCFSEALIRSPGSPIAFEYIYRAARLRNDRPRQVELLNQRLTTAESETLRIELLWEKARYCRMLGKRAAALEALEELLSLAPEHLPSLALTAELQLVDSQWEEAARSLEAVALHVETPEAERRSAGLHAADLFEKQGHHRQAIELLETLGQMGISNAAAQERKARSLARAGDWGAAYQVFSELNEIQDDIDSRLTSAQMMLAIQRDHLREPDQLKEATRRVLRDAPTDLDAVRLALELGFSTEEKRRLFAQARLESQQRLRKNPLDPAEIELFSQLCFQCGDDALERVALGVRALLGALPSQLAERLQTLQARCPRAPQQVWSEADLQRLAPALESGDLKSYVRLIAPIFSKELEANLQALGVNSLMRVDEFSNNPVRAEVSPWASSLRISDFELYLGGHDPEAISGLRGELPTLVVGSELKQPLSRESRARLAVQLAALKGDWGVFLNLDPETLSPWLLASTQLDSFEEAQQGDHSAAIAELSRSLSKAIPRALREELKEQLMRLQKSDINPLTIPSLAIVSAARVATLVSGDPTILRQLSELLPQNESERNEVIANIIPFCLGEDFFALRKKVGLESA